MKRKYIFESRSTFISRANKAWRDSSDSEKQKFLNSDPPPPTKSSISFFFKQKETANSANSPLTDNTSSVTISREVVMESSHFFNDYFSECLLSHRKQRKNFE